MKFKNLPNNYTGTIKIENGYIVEILDEEEKNYLSAVISPFKNKVISILKHTYLFNIDEGVAYLKITINNDVINALDFIYLPVFKEHTMYKGMVEDKEYTLKELGLDE